MSKSDVGLLVTLLILLPPAIYCFYRSTYYAATGRSPKPWNRRLTRQRNQYARDHGTTP